MLDRLVAHGLTGMIQLFTGARALWRGCAPDGGPRVYYGNHGSHGDFVMIWSALPPRLRRTARPVAGAEYWREGALRRFLIHDVFHGVLIERDPAARDNDPIETLAQAIDEGASLILFPEGTRNLGTGVLPFKSGIYHLSRARPELELVPVWIDNLNRVMPKGKVLPLPLLCTATFGAPIQLEPDETKDAFLARARTALLALSDVATPSPRDPEQEDA